MKIKLVLILCIICMSTSCIFGEEKGSGDHSGDKGHNQKRVSLQLGKSSSNIRPLDLIEDYDESSVEGYWLDGVVVISFAKNEGSANIRFTNMFTNENMNYNVDTNMPIYINIGYPDEPLRIVITTSVGNEYEGYLIVN
ncbi:MAG: hypothetical protein J6A20_09985 [Muribaculaceae bacterium]|nr:hypothetical protein [Muribaculaceae bacterium]